MRREDTLLAQSGHSRGIAPGFWHNLWNYFGPQLIVSVAYMDPGNYGTEISGGASLGYSMLWIVWLAGIMAMLLQYLSGKLGIATGYSLAELMRIYLKKRTYIVLCWLAAEIAAVMTDLAEFLGTVIALNLLFGLPLLYGTFLSVLDVVLIMGVTGGKVRRTEYVFMALISTIGIGYVFEIFITGPSLAPVVLGSVIPNLASTDRVLIHGRRDWGNGHAPCRVRSLRPRKRQDNGPEHRNKESGYAPPQSGKHNHVQLRRARKRSHHGNGRCGL